jgi:hypothetical protein
MPFGLVVVPEAAATAEERGARVFFTLEKMDVTRAYEDWSSSSVKGLKDVRLVISSASFVSLRDLEVVALKLAATGERT